MAGPQPYMPSMYGSYGGMPGMYGSYGGVAPAAEYPGAGQMSVPTQMYATYTQPQQPMQYSQPSISYTTQEVQQPRTYMEPVTKTIQVPKTVMEDHDVNYEVPKVEMETRTIQVLFSETREGMPAGRAERTPARACTACPERHCRAHGGVAHESRGPCGNCYAASMR